jgi:hypothetical protein
MPLDPPSGGTWIGANDAGLVVCLLNANPAASTRGRAQWKGRESRGAIVANLLAVESLTEVVSAAQAIDPERFPPFHVLVLRDGMQAIVRSNGRSIDSHGPTPLAAPLMLTSSGLGDHVVEPLRSALFERLLAIEPDPLLAQARFHAHQWTERPHLSVLMSRPDARTVSRTIVDVYPGSIEMAHTRLDDELRPIDPAVPVNLVLSTLAIAA